MTITSGTHLGPYEIQHLLGTGGMGEVYRARDPRLGREVAIKLITSDGAGSPERLRRFETEARAAAQLAHPNVVTVFDVGTHDGHPYLVLELLDGESLRETLRQGVPLLRQAVAWTLDVARGLGAAHERGIVHRDLKPENIFLTKDGRVKVLDFGLAKLHEPFVSSEAETESPTAVQDTKPGVILGTIGYMSPEQVNGHRSDARADVFALGSVLYELVSGRRAFGGTTTAQVLASILRDEPPSLMSLQHGVPASLEAVVRRCHGKRPSERFSSGNEVAAALETILVSFEPSRRSGVSAVDSRGPYPGLRSFTEAEAERFFGREEEIEALWEKLRQRRLLALIGPSGAGKTSFVRAGLLPARPSGWGAIVATPGSAPLRALAQALVGELPSDPDTLRELLAFEDPEVALRMVKKWRESHLETLLVVDQFEELFTLSPPETQASFAALLGRLAHEADVHVLLSLRDDFLIRCHEQEPLAPVFQNLTPLLALGGEGLRRALVEPAKREDFSFESKDLVKEMLESVSEARGALPLLAFAAARLWDKRDPEQKFLTRKAYEQIGGVAGALAEHAEQTLERIGFEREPIVRELFRNLVTSQWTRAVAEREQLLSVFPDRESAGQVLDALIDARLLTSYEVRDAALSSRGASSGTVSPSSSRGASSGTGDEGSAAPSETSSRHRIEIVHESLLRAWPRLVRWQAQDEEGAVLRDQLKQAAHLWEEKGRSPDVLWIGIAFQEYELWRDRYQGQLTALEDEYAQAMVARVTRQRRLRRGAVVAGFVLMAAVAAAIGVSRQEAVDQARRAEASKLLALAEARLEDDPTEAFAYTTASLELADSPVARVALLKALAQAPPASELVAGQGGRAAFSPDGQWLALAGFTQTVKVWRHDGTGPVDLPGHEVSQYGGLSAQWTPDGLLATGPGGTARVHLWSLPGGEKLRTLEFGEESLWAVGHGRVLTRTPATPSGRPPWRLRSWPLSGEEPTTLGQVDLGPHEFRIEPHGKGWLYTRGETVFYHPLPGREGQVDRVVSRHAADARLRGFFTPNQGYVVDETGLVSVLAFPPKGPRVAETYFAPGEKPPPGADAPPRPWRSDPMRRWIAGFPHADGKGHVWAIAAWPGARPLSLRRRGSWNQASARFDPRGAWYVTSTWGQTRLTFWPLPRQLPQVVEGTSTTWRPLAFSPDGQWLATPGSDEGLRIWPLPGNAHRRPKTLPSPRGLLWGDLAFDPQGRSLLAVGMSGLAEVVPLDGSPPSRLEGFSDRVVLRGVAVSPSGRRVASASTYGQGEKTLRVWDLDDGTRQDFELPPPAAAQQPGQSPTGYEQGVEDLAFADEVTLLTAGDGGLRRWNLQDGSHELVVPSPEQMWMSFDAGQGVALTLPVGPKNHVGEVTLQDLGAKSSRALPGFGDTVGTFALSGTLVVTGDDLGVIRVGDLSADEPHLLLGHEGAVDRVAISPDHKWIASTGEDNTLRLWPMPDLLKPPLHTLPRDELIAKLKSLTNLRAIRNEESSTGWTVEVGPFPGWKDVPDW